MTASSVFHLELSFPALLVTLFALFLTLSFVYRRIFTSRKSSSRTVLLIGPNLAGKTALFYRLTQNAFIETVSSLVQNSGVFQVAQQGTWELLDFPGHARMRPELQRLVSSNTPVAAVVLVVDKKCKEVAEIIFDLFASPAFRSPLILAVSKSDSDGFRAAGLVAAELERELDKLRESRMADGVFIGINGENFKLAKHSPVSVKLCSFSAKTGDIKGLLAAISKSLNS